MSRFFGAWLLLSAMVLFSCNNLGPARGPNHKRHTVTVAGSTSIMPFVEKLSEHFMVDRPDFSIDVQGGGSTAGIQACLNNTVNIGMSSRQLKEKERLLNQIIICYDGISIVVHPQNPVNTLTLKNVRDIFSGKIRNWSELGGLNRDIDAVTREEGSGTRGSFEELVMQGTEISDRIMVQDSNGSVKEVVATDPYAIGYISLGLVDEKVKAVTVDGVQPSIESIKLGEYKIVRPFLFVTNGELDQGGQKFVNFVLSEGGQNILKKEGLIGAYD
ncbi:phosphate ABC transporter substrate-binding protein [Syntrophorhabdus aromaticivorans]|uniref:phosphate ABC transporter substrate-binding protein n=1 Tax=Syntrophorhabdus aromaticivorans TaxID=328301 RepID=UPI0004269FBE|nr:phosphate ABC transporter substrate-binding protein [Syntrophorhabdus aromaticivorans]